MQPLSERLRDRVVSPSLECMLKGLGKSEVASTVLHASGSGNATFRNAEMHNKSAHYLGRVIQAEEKTHRREEPNQFQNDHMETHKHMHETNVGGSTLDVCPLSNTAHSFVVRSFCSARTTTVPANITQYLHNQKTRIKNALKYYLHSKPWNALWRAHAPENGADGEHVGHRLKDSDLSDRTAAHRLHVRHRELKQAA